jgi:hypothetical protein
VFLADPSNQTFEGTIKLHAGSLDKQYVTIFLNGKKIYSDELNKWDENITIKFPSSWIENGQNAINFYLPNAREPGNGDTRILALALKDLQIN